MSSPQSESMNPITHHHHHYNHLQEDGSGDDDDVVVQEEIEEEEEDSSLTVFDVEARFRGLPEVELLAERAQLIRNRSDLRRRSRRSPMDGSHQISGEGAAALEGDDEDDDDGDAAAAAAERVKIDNDGNSCDDDDDDGSGSGSDEARKEPGFEADEDTDTSPRSKTKTLLSGNRVSRKGLISLGRQLTGRNNSNSSENRKSRKGTDVAQSSPTRQSIDARRKNTIITLKKADASVDGNVFIGGDKNVSFGALKLRCLAQDHKYGYLTVEQFLEFGLRFGFQNEPFVNIFTITYKSFMTPKHVVSQLHTAFLSLYETMDFVSERNKMVERVLNLLYNFLDTCYADIQSEVQIIDEFFGFFAFLGRSASSDEGEERRYMRIQEFITELCEFLAKKSSGAAAHRTVDMAENLEERYNIIGKDDSKKRNTPRRSIFQLGLPLRDMPSATAHGNGIDTSPTSSPRILAIPTSSSPSLLSLESIPKAYPLSKGIRDPRRVRLEQIHPVEVARQLTLIEFQMFCKISSEELLGLGWMKESKEWSAPNITELISHSNLMSDWVTTTIVSTEPLKLRQKVLRHFILIAQSCFEINNFNTLFEICHALASQPVFRLSKTWEGIPKADMHKYRHLEEVTAFKSNRRNYRQELKRVQDKHRRPSTGNARYHTDSCLPYLGVHLTDLVFFDEGNPNEKIVQTELGSNQVYINFTKRSLMSQVVRDLLDCQRHEYILRPVDLIQEFVHWQLNACTLSNEEELFQLSKEREASRRQGG